MDKKIVRTVINKFVDLIIKSPKNLAYVGIYKSFEEVNEIYKLRGEYATESQFSDSKEKASALVNNFRSGEINRPDWETQRLNFLSVFVSGIVSKELSILDIGGGLQKLSYI